MTIDEANEIADSYQEWLSGAEEELRSGLFDKPITVLDKQPLLTVGPDDSVLHAAKSMDEHLQGAVLVMQDEKIVGILTERDLMRKLVCAGRSPADTKVSELMTADVETWPHDALIARVLQAMILGGFRHVPFVDGDGKPLGIVSMRMIADQIVNLFPQEILNAPPESAPPSAEGA